MPGICGTIDLETSHRIPVTLDAMLDSLCHEPWYTVECQTENLAGAGLGRVSLGFVNTAPQPAAAQDADLHAVMDGELYNSARLRADLISAGVGREFVGGQADLLLQGYLLEGEQFFRRVEGKFTAAIWNASQQQLLLVNDKFGMKPLYFADASGRMLFSSELKALLVNDRLSRAPNIRGIAQFFSFGQLWNEDTLYEAIQCLPPATCVRYNARNGALSLSRYWQLQPAELSDSASQAELLDRIADTFQQAVNLRCGENDQIGLALSGGLDARTILAFTPRNRVTMQCVSLGMEGSLDRQSARQLANLANCPFHGYTLGEGFLSRFREHFERMVDLTDGHYLSQCIVMPTLPLYRELGIKVLQRGHAGELMHLHKAYNFSLDRRALHLTDGVKLGNWLFGRLRAYMLDALDQPLLTFASQQDVDALAYESLGDSLSETSDWTSPVNRISHVFVSQRMRRETAMSLTKFNSVVETRLPYIDAELIPLLLATPPELRIGETIQSRMLQHHHPAFTLPANSNTGAPVGANVFSRAWHFGKMKVLARLGVKGYQPYERLGLWLRRELRSDVQDLLLNDRCLQRGVFQPDTVRSVVDQHSSGKRNHTFLLLAMMIYEAGQRRFSDADPAPQLAAAESSNRQF